MRAWLEVHVERRALRGGSGLAERDDLSVRGAEARVKPLADDVTFRDDDRADHRVRRGLRPPTLGERERATHEFPVRAPRVVGHGAPGDLTGSGAGRTIRRPASGRPVRRRTS